MTLDMAVERRRIQHHNTSNQFTCKDFNLNMRGIFADSLHVGYCSSCFISCCVCVYCSSSSGSSGGGGSSNRYGSTPRGLSSSSYRSEYSSVFFPTLLAGKALVHCTHLTRCLRPVCLLLKDMVSSTTATGLELRYPRVVCCVSPVA